MLDPLAKAILETIGGAGYIVNVEANKLTAIDEKAGERFIVRYDREDFYDAVVELAL